MGKIITGLILLSSMSFNMLAENFHVYREEFVTPHWAWEMSQKKSLNVLFLVNRLAMRDPEELAQRFPSIKPLLVPTSGNSYKNKFDEKFLLEELGKKPDLIVIAARELFRDLSAEAKTALLDKLRSGTPILCLCPDAGWKELIKIPETVDKGTVANTDPKKAPKELPGNAVGKQFERMMPWKELKFRNGKIDVNEYLIGKGRLLLVAGYDMHWTFHTAFEPTPYAAFTYDYEIAMALAARMVFFATGETPDTYVESAASEGGEATFMFNRLLNTGMLRWKLYSEFGEQLADGSVQVNNANTVKIAIPQKYCGKTFLLYSLEADGKPGDFGILQADSPRQSSFAEVVVPDFNPQGKPVKASWTLKGKPDNAIVSGEVYDPDLRLMARFDAPSEKGETLIPYWLPSFVTHELRLKLLSDGKVLDERRIELNIQANRAEDSKRFNVTFWNDDTFKWRLLRLRHLGATAVTQMGKNVSVAGLRLNPVNVCVPIKDKFDPEARRKKLSETVTSCARYSPLGYLLSDEPSFANWHSFRDWAAEIIHNGDKGAPVGFSGIWFGAARSTGTKSEEIACCDNLIGYSPQYLYTPNLWKGIERDVFRSFVGKSSIFSYWTQYCPGEDHEAYARTTPWLWLFEGTNGISIFSALEFSGLGGDLRTTHEARWWSEELLRLHRGIGEQLISMDRDSGDVRLLFPENVPSGIDSHLVKDFWARTLNEMAVPYKFVSSPGLDSLEREKVKLLVCPAVLELSGKDVKSIERYVRSGGVLLATAPTGLLDCLREVPQDEFWLGEAGRSKMPANEANEINAMKYPAPIADVSALFGFSRNFPAGVQTFKVMEQLRICAKVPIEMDWAGGPFGSEPAKVVSGGDIPSPGTAKPIAMFANVKTLPDYLQQMAQSPAVLENKLGKGTAYYLNFSCSSEQMRQLVEWLSKQTGFRRCLTQVKVKDLPANATYLYPMTGGGIEMLGVVQDYIKIPPVKMNKDKGTAIYFQHGPKLWEQVPAELCLAEPRHIYDSRQGNYLGFGKTASFSLQAGRPELFTLLPYKITGISLDCPAKVKGGEILQIKASLDADRKPIGNHVVNFQLTAPDGTELASNAKNTTLKGGTGTFQMQIPFNAQKGKWQIVAQDAVTGIKTSRALDVDTSVSVPYESELAVRHIKLDLPEGAWADYKEDNPVDLEKVQVKISPLTRTAVKTNPYFGKLVLQFKSQLSSRTGHFNMTYSVNNDYQAMGWQDKRQVQPNSMGGLGISSPMPYVWNVNGFLSVYFDDKHVTGFAVSSVKEISSGNNGGIEVEWDSPHGKLTADFMMELNHDALFTRLTAAPNLPCKKISVKLRSYPGGFSTPNKNFIWTMRGKDYKGTKFESKPDVAFALYADEINDFAFGKSDGPGGIHVLPGEWDSVSYGFSSSLEKSVDIPPGQTRSFHFALRMFPKATNENAFYMIRDSHSDTMEVLADLYKTVK